MLAGEWVEAYPLLVLLLMVVPTIKENKSWSKDRQQSQAKLFYAYGGNYFQVGLKLTFELSKVFGLNRCFTSRIDQVTLMENTNVSPIFNESKGEQI